ncbi:MAG TPA: YggS family pyridoxal phosphate-dependent enzyme [Dehalococcoidia bacterium]|nr:YggS family pyridoxal phosphate-dependent enzyme [Dehalococcoidia bacterium]
MSSISDNIRDVQNRIAQALGRSHRTLDEITLVAVTKEHDAAAVREAFDCGLRHFGENRVQEAESKLPPLADIRSRCTWHMIGHLQSNKAAKAMELFDIIHSIDSIKLATILNQHAKKRIPILLEVNVSEEFTKSGLYLQQVSDIIEQIGHLTNLDLQGLMTIAPFEAEEKELRRIFRTLRELRNSLGLKHLSMGMTDDFEIAIEEGATMLRIGRALFGSRR